jgi:energy-coupling factor transport system substrate-specific component
VTWQVGAFAILALALAGGFAWYERTRPDARIVALVGTLAAFAALGRIAFVALPNVKPTTDIVLVSGYGLGGGPGFAVGALAGLTSNFFLGQGPWTPWQMAGWGITGVIGAGLALATGRRIGRWSLAIVCTVVGFAFTVLQDVGGWVTYSDHSLAALGVYVGKGIGFDCVHAAGCLVFALALGPAMIHSLGRFATRLQVRWEVAGPVAPARPARRPGRIPRSAALLLLTVGWLAGQPGLGGVGTGGADGGVATAQAASTPAGYLLAAQNPDGGFGDAPGAGSAQLYAGWAALGLAASGTNPQDVSRSGHTLIDYIRGGIGSATDPGSIERTILVARAAGLSPASFGGRNLVATLQRDIRSNGSVSGLVNQTAFAVLALRAAGVAPPRAAIGWLVRQQDSDGGFNFATRGGLSDPDDTGAALEALAGSSGAAAHARVRAIGFLHRQQDADGGFASQPGAGSNAQSTAFAVQGLIAAGVDPRSVRRHGASPLDYLRSLTAPDGHVRYSRGTDQTPVWVTAEALMALDGKALPLGSVPRRAVPRPTTPRSTTPPSSTATSTRAGGTRRPTARSAFTHRRRSAPRARSTALAVRAQPPSTLDRLASDAGIVTAVLLAAVGAS